MFSRGLGKKNAFGGTRGVEVLVCCFCFFGFNVICLCVFPPVVVFFLFLCSLLFGFCGS